MGMKLILGESCTGRDKGSDVRRLSVESDIISRKGGFVEAKMIRSCHAPTAQKGLELRDLPPSSDSTGTGFIWFIFFGTLFWLAVVFWFCLEG